MNTNLIIESLTESQRVHERLLDSVDSIEQAAGIIVNCLKNGGKVLVCGNGGSAADAIHFSAELSGKFEKNRRPLPAIALNENVSAITAIANDFGYDEVFSRQIVAIGKRGDVLILISTSGRSENIYRAALLQSTWLGKKVILLTGGILAGLADLCDIVISVPSFRTARIQEAHITILHCIAEIVDKEFSE